MSNINKLESSLDKSIEDFKDQMKTHINDIDTMYLTKEDLDEFTRQTYYALNDFKTSIISYLKEQK